MSRRDEMLGKEILPIAIAIIIAVVGFLAVQKIVPNPEDSYLPAIGPVLAMAGLLIYFSTANKGK